MTHLLWINLIISLLLALGSRVFLDRFFKDHPWCFYLFIFLLSCCVPVLGEIIGSFIIILIYWKHTKFHEHTEVLDNEINLLQIKPFYAQYGAGGAILSLLNQNISTDVRTAALFRIAQSPLSKMNSLLYQLLPDNSDEIRLLAFNILDEQEGKMTQSINQLQSMLKQEGLIKETQAKLEKNLAYLYWDLVYDHLIIHELEDSMLQKAQSYAVSAITVLSHDANLWALLGKIYSRLKQDSCAEEAFNKASALNIDPAKVTTYLAEIYFRRHDYVAVQKYLSATSSLIDVGLMAPVQRFWNK